MVSTALNPRYSSLKDIDGIKRSLDTLVAFNRRSAKTHSGIWRDLAVRKRRTEVIMYEPILAEGEKIGVDLPLTRRWIEMIREIEAGRRPQALGNLDELKAAIAMNIQFDKTVAVIVTGAAHGFGRAISLAFRDARRGGVGL